MKLGYVRVSSADQSLDRQLATMARLGIEEKYIYADKLSGKNTDRPSLKRLLGFAREGDHIYIHSADRLSRSLIDLIATVESLTQRGIAVTFVDNNLTFDSSSDNPFNMALLQVMGVFGQLQRSLIKKAQSEGIAAKRAAGTWEGRGAGKKVKELRGDIMKWLADGGSIAKTAAKFGVSKSTVQKIKSEMKEAAK
ncbi:Resolvase for Tn21 [Enterobacter hormaechei]|uniref:recombinase family protein n=1 Tax=Enterobacter hormaechei TaxID=158836 RepID=UPI000795739C|nr:recombinase family protein [Enterobacter hormaechei]CZY40423.1 Resolvase for Tn21 [Enterobacter hormaechei]SAH60958.1 Resolvase for Tn21 [Enterobacter hormaechei]